MSISVPRSRNLRRRAAGTLWLAAWCGVLWAVAAPWRNLGGLESERLRWLEWCVLTVGLALGFTMGRLARDWAVAGAGRTHARALRVALYPPAIVAAAALVVLSVTGERGPVGVVATAFLSYWAGLDVAFGAVPLMEGKPYAFARPLDPEEDFRTTWDRF
jgi:hypothetical protein